MQIDSNTLGFLRRCFWPLSHLAWSTAQSRLCRSFEGRERQSKISRPVAGARYPVDETDWTGSGFGSCLVQLDRFHNIFEIRLIWPICQKFKFLEWPVKAVAVRGGCNLYTCKTCKLSLLHLIKLSVFPEPRGHSGHVSGARLLRETTQDLLCGRFSGRRESEGIQEWCKGV